MEVTLFPLLSSSPLLRIIKELAEDVLMTPEQGDERTRFLAAAGMSCTARHPCLISRHEHALYCLMPSLFLFLSSTVFLPLSLSLYLYAVFESLMETALEENRRMNSDRAEAMLVRAYNMYRHPLLISLQTEAAAAALADPSSVSPTMFKGTHPSIDACVQITYDSYTLYSERTEQSDCLRLLQGIHPGPYY
jgi:hypothetical protein